jgi:hypothetical protein
MTAKSKKPARKAVQKPELRAGASVGNSTEPRKSPDSLRKELPPEIRRLMEMARAAEHKAQQSGASVGNSTEPRKSPDSLRKEVPPEIRRLREMARAVEHKAQHSVASASSTAPKKAPASPGKPLSPEVSEWLGEATGSKHRMLQMRLFGQALDSVSDFDGNEAATYFYLQQALSGIAPKDELEGMIAVQMVAFHSLIMDCFKLGVHPKQSVQGLDGYINRATKLGRTFAALAEALGRYRSRGHQTMTVEHIHVHPGGKAFVGQVSQTNTQIRRDATHEEDHNKDKRTIDGSEVKKVRPAKE